MKFEGIKNEKPKKVEKIQVTIEDKLKDFFSEIFRNESDPEKRLANIYSRVPKFFDPTDNHLDEADIQTMKNHLENVSKIEDADEFLSEGLKAFTPLINWHNEDKISFEKKLRENTVASKGFTPLNEMVTYGKEKDFIHIHVSPSETLGLSEKIMMTKDAFSKLAEIVKQDENMKEIVASSWIVAANPGLMKNFGFTVDEPISGDELKEEKENAAHQRPEATARISRDDLLRIYGK